MNFYKNSVSGRNEHSASIDSGLVLVEEGVRAEQVAAENWQGSRRKGQVGTEEVHVARAAQSHQVIEVFASTFVLNCTFPGAIFLNYIKQIVQSN
jgi:hypothetical protein